MRKRSLLLLPLAAALALGACDGGGTGSDSSRVSIRLKDAPGDLAEAWVRIDRIYLQGRSSADSLDGRVEFPLTTSDWIDLTDLSGANFREIVSGFVVPAGSYSQLRVVVCEAYVVTDGGDVYATDDAELPAGVSADGELRIPSGCSSGFKVKLPGGNVELEDDAEILLVDFDVSQSFGHQAGNSGAWIMRPVMTATSIEFSGGIAGTVAVGTGVTLPSCGGAAVTVGDFVPLAVAGADSLSAIVNDAGQYSITAAPGTYTMGYASPVSFTNGDSLTWTAAPAPASVTVASGGTATASYTISAATCKVKA